VDINLVKIRGEKGKVSVIPYKNGFRSSITITYKNGETERLQKYSSESPEKAIEKLYKYASDKYYANLYKVEDEIVFAPKTNRELSKIEKEIPNEIVEATKDNLLFENVAKGWLDNKLKDTDKENTNRSINNNTFEYYRTMTYGYLVKYFKEYKITELTIDNVQKIFDSKINLGFKTLKGLRSILGQILDFSIDKGYISFNFAEKIILPTYIKPDIDFYNQKEIETFKEICSKDGRTIAILYRTELALGLRPEEVCGLKWNRIKFSKSDDELALVKIDNAFKDIKIYDKNHNIIGHEKKDDTLKTPESYRTIPLSKEDEKELLKFKEKEMKRLGKSFREDGYVFLNRYGRPYTSEILTNKMPSFLLKWKLPHITPYGLRHSFASLMAKLGVSEAVLKVMMGHTDISTTHKYYIHLNEYDIMQEMIEKVENKEKENANETNKRLEKMEEMMKRILLANQMNIELENNLEMVKAS